MLPIEHGPRDEIENANARFLQGLTGRETVGVDNEGRLYTASGMRSVGVAFGKLFKSAQEGINETVNRSLKACLREKTSQWQQEHPSVQTIRTFYDSLIGKLSRAGILSDANKELLLRDKYDQIHNALVAGGRAPFVAESMVTIEMNQDPLVPESMKQVIRPELTRSGVNGTYIVKNRKGENIGIFKPSDEEVNMPNSPRVKASDADAYDKTNPKRLGAYHGHVQGTGWIKEIGAYLIAKRSGIADVPVTVKMTVPFPERHGSPRLIEKEGSLQKFIPGEVLESRKHDEIMKIPAQEIHKIVLFDLLIGNADRNLGNCFIKGNGSESHLSAIDHGFSLLDSLTLDKPMSETNCHLAALPQLKEACSKELIEGVLSLTNDEIMSIVESLRRQGVPFSSACLKELKMRAMLLQVALNDGYTLAQIAPMFMLMRDSPLIETLAKDKDVDKLLSQWEKGDLSGLSSTLGKTVKEWIQASEERAKKEEAESEV